MTTYNTTNPAIATGAAANASTFNTPIGDLDESIGDLSSFSPGHPDVATILAVSLDTDGTLKAGAVDNAAALASDVVTTAKILDANVTTAKLANDAVTHAKLAMNGNIDNETLLAWAYADAYKMSNAPTYDSTYTSTISAFNLVWPDGSAGAFASVAIDSDWEYWTEYTLTHTDSSKTVTFSGLVLDSATGLVTTQYTVTVS